MVGSEWKWGVKKKVRSLALPQLGDLPVVDDAIHEEFVQ